MILHYLEVAFVFLIMLTVLVAAHEYGHYVFARLFGMAVEEFSIGMGGSKPLLVYHRRKHLIPITAEQAEFVRSMKERSEIGVAPTGTESTPLANALQKLESGSDQLHFDLVDTPNGPALEETTAFTIRPYPIGGFVRIKGMLPQEDGGEVDVLGGFYNKAPWKRFITLLAGPVFSVMAGVLVLIPLFLSTGVPRVNTNPVLGTVLDGAAAKAGLRTYDKIISIDNQPITSFYEVITKVQNSAGVPLHVAYQRDNQTHETVMTPIMEAQPSMVLGPDLMPTGEITRHAIIGVAPLSHLVKASLGEATADALKAPIMVATGLIGVIKRPSMAKEVVGGPGTMIKVTSDAVYGGFTDIVDIAAEISISLGFFNLLPIFPLDGGQMAVAIAEMLRGGRRLSLKVQNTVGVVGFATVLLLVCCVLTVDVGRLTGKHDPAPKIISSQKPDK